MENTAVVQVCNDSVRISSVSHTKSLSAGSLEWKADCKVNSFWPGVSSGVHLVVEEHFIEYVSVTLLSLVTVIVLPETVDVPQSIVPKL